MSARRILSLAAFAVLAWPGSALRAQPLPDGRVPIAWNRYLDFDELMAKVDALAAAYPELVRLERIGQSLEGRPLVVAVVRAPALSVTEELDRPAMWIDGNVHGNEIQASEVVLYALWQLTRGYGANPAITRLVDENVFYLLVSQNPDGRAHWFAHAHTSSSSRSNLRPVDDDQDGLFDEDPPNDLDGDGSITQMWREDPHGRWRQDDQDPRVFRRVAAHETGGWTLLGSEGIDDDGDGRIDEDDPGGDDMNRNWPSDWQPEHVQFGAGPFPLSHPETRAIARFLAAHPNVAAVQSYHNAGGMILRGPGAAYKEGDYSAADRRVYDELGKAGEQLLPFYRYMVIHEDLYTVHGGFVNWTAEGLGIFSFTNELWSSDKYFQREAPQGDDPFADRNARMMLFRDRLEFGTTYKDLTPFQHPTWGEVWIGGVNKWGSRVTPPFLLEEEAHRNFGFTMLHADHMPKLALGRVHQRRLAGGAVAELTVEIANDRILPTRSARAAAKGIGAPDVATIAVEGGRVVAGGTVERLDAERMSPVAHEPARLVWNEGIPGRGRKTARWLVAGGSGARVTLRVSAEKAKDLEATLTLE